MLIQDEPGEQHGAVTPLRSHDSATVLGGPASLRRRLVTWACFPAPLSVPLSVSLTQPSYFFECLVLALEWDRATNVFRWVLPPSFEQL